MPAITGELGGTLPKEGEIVAVQVAACTWFFPRTADPKKENKVNMKEAMSKMSFALIGLNSV